MTRTTRTPARPPGLALAGLALGALAAGPAGASVTIPAFPAGTTSNGVTTAYSTTAGTYSFTDPANVTSLQVSLWGAGGGIGGGPNGGGSPGSYLTGVLAVTPGNVYSIIVGGPGRNGSNLEGGSGGNPDGSSGGNASTGGGGGGGSSSITLTSTNTVEAEAPGGNGGSSYTPPIGPRSLSPLATTAGGGGLGGGMYITTGLSSYTEGGAAQYSDPNYKPPASAPTTAGEVALVYSPNASAAPEPSQVGMLALMAAGLGGLMLRARRRQARA